MIQKTLKQVYYGELKFSDHQIFLTRYLHGQTVQCPTLSINSAIRNTTAAAARSLSVSGSAVS